MQGPAPDLPKAVAAVAEPEMEVRVPGTAKPRFKAPGAKKKKDVVNWLIFLLVLGGVPAAAYHFRQQIVDYWPPAARLYTELGVKLRVVGEGLEIRNLNLSNTRRGGDPVLVVAGEIANTTQEAKDVPGLRGALLDSQKRELQHWTFASGHDRLLPGEVAAFQTEVVNPKPGATNISITFTAERAQPPAEMTPAGH